MFSVIFRWLLASGIGFLFFKLIAAASAASFVGAAVLLLFAMVCLITFALLISPETVGRFCELLSRPFTAVIMPEDRFSKPPLSYLLARRYSKQLRPLEAIEEYKKIIQYYPRERDAYVEILAVAEQVQNKRLFRKYSRLLDKRFKYSVPFKAPILLKPANPPDDEKS